MFMVSLLFRSQQVAAEKNGPDRKQDERRNAADPEADVKVHILPIGIRVPQQRRQVEEKEKAQPHDDEANSGDHADREEPAGEPASQQPIDDDEPNSHEAHRAHEEDVRNQLRIDQDRRFEQDDGGVRDEADHERRAAQVRRRSTAEMVDRDDDRDHAECLQQDPHVVAREQEPAEQRNVFELLEVSVKADDVDESRDQRSERENSHGAARDRRPSSGARAIALFATHHECALAVLWHGHLIKMCSNVVSLFCDLK